MTRFRAIVVLLTVLLPSFAAGQTYTLSPSPFQTALDNSGKIINGACVWTYTAGTTTAATTYSDNAGTTNANPIIADSAGRFVAYLTPGNSYKFTYENTPCSASSHGTVLKTQDNITAVPTSSNNVDITATAGETLTANQVVYWSDGSGGKTAGQIYKADSANAYSSIANAIGIVPNACASGLTTCTVRVRGYITGLSALSVGSTYYVGAAGAITTTAPGNRRKVGEADTATTLIVRDNELASGFDPTVRVNAGTPYSWTFPTADASGLIKSNGSGTLSIGSPVSVQTTTSTGSVNNFAATVANFLVLRANNATSLTLTGITAGSDGDEIVVEAIGAGDVLLTNADAGSTAANQILTGTASTLTLSAQASSVGQQSAIVRYDGTTARWRVVSIPRMETCYTVTTTDVVSVAVLTTAWTTTIPANTWLDGEKIVVTGTMLIKNAKGTNGSMAPQLFVGGVQAGTLTNTAQVSDANENQISFSMSFFRSGTTVYGPGAFGASLVGQAAAATSGDLYRQDWSGSWGEASWTPTFTGDIAIAYKVTPSASDATFYLKPRSMMACKLKAN